MQTRRADRIVDKEMHTDVVTAMRPKEVSDALDLQRIAKDHTWKVEPSCATTGEGIFEGLAWLSSNVKLPSNK